MHIGILEATLELYTSNSLKDKRQVIKSLVETTRQKFNVSIAEIDDLDSWKTGRIGVAIVSNDSQHCNRVLDKVLDYWDTNPLFEVSNVGMEID